MYTCITLTWTTKYNCDVSLKQIKHILEKCKHLINTHDSESRGQEEVSRTLQMSEIFTSSTTLNLPML